MQSPCDESAVLQESASRSSYLANNRRQHNVMGYHMTLRKLASVEPRNGSPYQTGSTGKRPRLIRSHSGDRVRQLRTPPATGAGNKLASREDSAALAPRSNGPLQT